MKKRVGNSSWKNDFWRPWLLAVVPLKFSGTETADERVTARAITDLELAEDGRSGSEVQWGSENDLPLDIIFDDTASTSQTT
ncbi:Fc.00g049810.m01.CDS01 [Cosmosporella sp. VM-42]